MSEALTPEAQSQLELGRRGRTDAVRGAERRVLLCVSALWVVAATGLWLAAPPGPVHLAAVVCTAFVLTLAVGVRFETPVGFTVASQVAFVPLLFLTPAALVPPLTALACGLAFVPDLLRGRLHPDRLVYVLRNSWFALGPAWTLALLRGAHLSEFAELVPALLAQLVVDVAVSGITTRATRSLSLREQLDDAWIYLVDLALSGVGFLIVLASRAHPAAVLLVIPLLGVLTLFGRERTAHLDNLIELGETYKGTALLLGDLVEADDDYTGKHSQGVVALALAVGDHLGLDPTRRRNLEFAALLHDVGKIAIPKAIINKPGPLTAAEFALVQTHPAEGQRMLARVGGFMVEVGRIVRAHHERWDGGGYPDGLRGEAAPREARIITCCDSWSAMRTDRPYRRALSHAAAVAEMRRHTGTQFDPTITAALLAVVDPDPLAAGEPEPAPEALDTAIPARPRVAAG